MDGVRFEDMEGMVNLLNGHVPSEEEWAPSRFNAGGLKNGAMTKEKEREGEGETALCLLAGSRVHAERRAYRELILTETVQASGDGELPARIQG